MMAITADGKIGKTKDHLANWTSPEDKQLFVKTSKQHGVILMGENTFKTFKKPLPGRLNVVFSRQTNLPKIKDVLWVKGQPGLVLNKLKRLGYRSALLGGGASLNSLFLKDKLITEMILTIEPKLFAQGLSIFSSEIDVDIDLKLLDFKKLNDNSLMLHYQLIYPTYE